MLCIDPDSCESVTYEVGPAPAGLNVVHRSGDGDRVTITAPESAKDGEHTITVTATVRVRLYLGIVACSIREEFALRVTVIGADSTSEQPEVPEEQSSAEECLSISDGSSIFGFPSYFI